MRVPAAQQRSMSRLADARVKKDEGPGFGGIAGILALSTALTLVSLSRRKRR